MSNDYHTPKVRHPIPSDRVVLEALIMGEFSKAVHLANIAGRDGHNAFVEHFIDQSRDGNQSVIWRITLEGKT